MNAYEILANYNRQARRAKLSPEAIRTVIDKAKQGDYDYLCLTIAEALEELQAIK